MKRFGSEPGLCLDEQDVASNVSTNATRFNGASTPGKEVQNLED